MVGNIQLPGSGWSSACRSVRWRPGAVFDEARFKEETISGQWNSHVGGVN